jgi:hypothetical protein
VSIGCRKGTSALSLFKGPETALTALGHRDPFNPPNPKAKWELQLSPPVGIATTTLGTKESAQCLKAVNG